MLLQYNKQQRMIFKKNKKSLDMQKIKQIIKPFFEKFFKFFVLEQNLK